MQYKKGRASQTTSRFDDVDVAGWLEIPKKTLVFASDWHYIAYSVVSTNLCPLCTYNHQHGPETP